MSTALDPFPSPPPIRSAIFKKPPDSVPSTDELESLQAELKLLKQRTLERARKAGEDMKMIEESMRRIKEREKGKAKATEKIKKERGYTPHLDGDDHSLSNHSPPNHQKTRLPSVSSTSSAPYASSRPLLDSRSFDDKKKKKRKRDLADSDGEPESQRPRKASPQLLNHSISQSSTSQSHVPKSLKVPTTVSTPKTSGGQDWSIPPSTSMLPTRPPTQAPPPPGPSKPSEVIEDFSKLKPPNQTQSHTFYTYIEPWLRPIKEEDIGLLEFVPDEVDAFIVPPLGRHYSQVWADEDNLLYGGPLPGTAAVNPVAGPSQSSTRPKWEPATLADDDLLGEERGHGPLTERLVSALLPTPDQVRWKGVKAAEEAMEGRSAGGSNAAAARDSMTIGDVEDRVRDSMRLLGLLDETVDPSQYEPVDDSISTALRQAQHLLRPLIAANKARKRRLLSIARDRLGYQEYLDLRDSIDKNISSIYTKLWNKDQPHTDEKKDKKKKSSAAKAGPTLPKHPAAHGLQLDEELNLVVPDNLKELVATRRQWVDKVGTVFDQMQEEHPGRISGFPQRSIYEDMEEEVREEMARAPKWKPILHPKPHPEPEVPAEVDAAAQAGDMDWLGAELGAELDADMEFV